MTNQPISNGIMLSGFAKGSLTHSLRTVMVDHEAISKAQLAAELMISGTDTRESMDQALELLCEATGMDSSAVALVDPTKRRLTFFASSGTGQNYMKDYDEMIGYPPGHAPLEYKVLHKHRQIVIPNTVDPMYRPFVDERTIKEGIRCLVIGPIMVQNDSIGLMWMGGREARKPTVEQLAAFEIFRRYVALPLVISQRGSYLERLSLSLADLSTFSFRFFDSLVAHTVELTESDVACLALLDKPLYLDGSVNDRDRIRADDVSLGWVATRGCSPEYHKGWSVRLRECPVEVRAFSQKSLQSLPIISADSANSKVDPVTLKEGLGSHCCAPLIVPEEQGGWWCRGVLYCSNYIPHTYSDKQRQALKILADRAAWVLHTQELLTANRGLAVLSKGVRHTLRGAISRLASRLSNLELPCEAYEEALTPIQAVAEKLSDFTKLRVFSRSMELYPVIKDIIAGDDVRVKWTCDEDVTVFADSTALATALGDVIENAREHRRKNTKVRVTIHAHSERVVIQVFNVGEWIPANTLNALGSELIYSEKGEGHGVGICFAAHLVRQQEGRLKYSNVCEPYKGVCCVVELQSTVASKRTMDKGDRENGNRST